MSPSLPQSHGGNTKTIDSRSPERRLVNSTQKGQATHLSVPPMSRSTRFGLASILLSRLHDEDPDFRYVSVTATQTRFLDSLSERDLSELRFPEYFATIPKDHTPVVFAAERTESPVESKGATHSGRTPSASKATHSETDVETHVRSKRDSERVPFWMLSHFHSSAEEYSTMDGEQRYKKAKEILERLHDEDPDFRYVTITKEEREFLDSLTEAEFSAVGYSGYYKTIPKSKRTVPPVHANDIELSLPLQLLKDVELASIGGDTSSDDDSYYFKDAGPEHDEVRFVLSTLDRRCSFFFVVVVQPHK